LRECPIDDKNDQLGWSQWAIDMADDLIYRIAQIMDAEISDVETMSCSKKNGRRRDLKKKRRVRGSSIFMDSMRGAK